MIPMWNDASVPPPESGEYLVCDCREYDTTEVLYYQDNAGWKIDECSLFDRTDMMITHWMKLPEQPTTFSDSKVEWLGFDE